MKRTDAIKKFSGSAEKLITDVYNVGYGAGYARAVEQERAFIVRRGGAWLYNNCYECGYYRVDQQGDGRGHCMINDGVVVNASDTCQDHWRAKQ